MNPLEVIQKENEDIINNMTQLVQTETSRSELVSAVFVRTNIELRLQNIKEVEGEIINGAKYYGILPEKYVGMNESIKKSYIEQINKFMKSYNEQYMGIQSVLQRAEEKQKVLMFQSCKYSNNKRMYMLTENYKVFQDKKNSMIDEYKKTNNIKLYQEIQNLNDPCSAYNSKIENIKNDIKFYENIIARCDREFQDCRARRQRDFEEIFGNSKQLAVVENKPFYVKLFRSLTNKFTGENRFSKYIIKKHSEKINNIKVNVMDQYVNKIKQDMVAFESEIEDMINKK